MKQIPEINPLELLHDKQEPLTREQLAELLGVTPDAISKWQAKKRNPSLPAQKLAYLVQHLRSLKQETA